MHRKYNKFLIVSFVAVSMFGVYSYFYNDLKSEAASNALSSSLDSNTVAATTNGVKATEDTAFLQKLVSLTKININTSLLSDQSFLLLIDNNVQLEVVPSGRINPFSPVGNNVTNIKSSVVVKTNQAVSITNKSAVLTGSIEGGNSNNIYFDYGNTQALGKITPKLAPSLVGNFSSNIIGLTPQATYFYRSAANVGGTVIFGEIMSFTTN